MYLNALTRHSSTVCKSFVSVTQRNLVLEKPRISKNTLNFIVSHLNHYSNVKIVTFLCLYILISRGACAIYLL